MYQQTHTAGLLGLPSQHWLQLGTLPKSVISASPLREGSGTLKCLACLSMQD